jgi:quercetin dioxygenase-like cupin family protein
MLTRRGFAGCAVCAGVGLLASAADAQSQPAPTAGISRTVIQTTDLNDTHVTVLVVAEIAPGAVVARHTHPGVESTYVLEGEVDLAVEGQPDERIKAGGGFQVAPGTPHGARNGDRTTKIASTFVVEKGKPLASPA